MSAERPKRTPENEMFRDYYGFIHKEDFPFVKYAADALLQSGVTNVQVEAAPQQIGNDKNWVTTRITGRHSDIRPGAAIIFRATTSILELYINLIEKGYDPYSDIVQESVDAKLNGIIQRERDKRSQRRSA